MLTKKKLKRRGGETMLTKKTYIKRGDNVEQRKKIYNVDQKKN